MIHRFDAVEYMTKVPAYLAEWSTKPVCMLVLNDALRPGMLSELESKGFRVVIVRPWKMQEWGE